jgi:monofunctional biosynthetic peptidoglycan transglycosylase
LKKLGFKRPKRRPLRAILLWLAGAALGIYACLALSILALRWINPVSTSVQIQRRVEAWRAHQPYLKRYRFVPMARI